MDKYASPETLLSADKNEVIEIIRTTARFGIAYAEKKYLAVTEVAKAALVFDHSVSSSFTLIRLYINFIRKYDDEIETIVKAMNELVSPTPMSCSLITYG